MKTCLLLFFNIGSYGFNVSTFVVLPKRTSFLGELEVVNDAGKSEGSGEGTKLSLLFMGKKMGEKKK